ncbi:MAG: hypothetical protein V4719_00830 [Planctomycetota bacterium]
MPSPSASLAYPRLDLGAAFEQFDLEMNRRGFISHQVLPIFDTPLQANAYPIIPIEQMLQNRELLRAPGASYSRGKWTFKSDGYACQEYGTEEPVDDREAAMYRTMFDAESVATMRALEALLNGAEQRAVSLLTDTNVITQTAAASVAWSTPATATPITDFNTARNAVWASTGIWVNAIVMSRNKFNHLRECAQIIDRIKSNANYKVLNGEITEAMLATAFDVDRIIVSGAAKNTAKEGQTATVASTWTDSNVLVCRVATTNDVREPCIGRTFHWAEDGSQPLGQVEMYRDESIRSNVIRVRHDVVEKVMYAKAGYLITGA